MCDFTFNAAFGIILQYIIDGVLKKIFFVFFMYRFPNLGPKRANPYSVILTQPSSPSATTGAQARKES